MLIEPARPERSWSDLRQLITIGTLNISEVRGSELACPYFMPVAKLENGNWPHPARLPLGAGWNGHCTAPGHEGQPPAQDVLETFCNLGYASGCSWTPEEPICDTVRFGAAPTDPAGRNRLRDAASLPSPVLVLRYVCERDHKPVEHGELEFDLLRASWLRQHANPCIQKMAECFLETYLKKKS